MPKRIVRRSSEDDGEDKGFDPKEEDEDEAPRRGGVKSAASKARRSSEDDDSGDEDKGKNAVRRGWGGAKRVREMGGDFPDELKLTEEPVLIKFLEEEPFASYRQHWIERSGKKSFTCLEDDCPLCDIGDRPSGKYCFNVLVLSEGEPVNKQWVVGSRLLTSLENFATDKKTGPLTKHYWSISRSGKKGNQTTNVVPVKERDLAEDWEIDPLDDDVIEKFMKGCYDDTAVQVQTRKQLREIAEEVSDED